MGKKTIPVTPYHAIRLGESFFFWPDPFFPSCWAEGLPVKRKRKRWGAVCLLWRPDGNRKRKVGPTDWWTHGFDHRSVFFLSLNRPGGTNPCSRAVANFKP